MEKFCTMIEDEVKEIGAIYRDTLPLEMTAEDNENFSQQWIVIFVIKSCAKTRQFRLTKNEFINLVYQKNIKIPQNLV